jgi:beta-lactamase regulating signal transducer with metallopeptidase domain
MNFMQHLATAPEVHRIGWTLLHFVWQGAAVAFLFMAGRLLLRGASSQSRYLAGCAALALLCLAPVVTFWSIPVNSASPPGASDHGGNILPNAPADPLVIVSVVERRSAAKSPTQAASAVHGFDRVLPVIVVLWTGGVLLLSLRLFCSWRKVQALVRDQGEPISAEWRDRVARLKETMRVSRPVRIIRSMAVQVPTVAGWIKPVILLPASSLTGLTPQQLESILAHELAHIRRQDYLVNLLQNLAETLLFYHPAVWWISGCIRRERELCCDDEAVRACGDSFLYARALTLLEELRSAPSGLAQAADGGSLLYRVRRLVSGTGHPRGAGWGATGGAVVLVLLGMGLILIPLARGEKQESQGATPPAASEAAEPAGELLLRHFRIDPAFTRKKLKEVLVNPAELPLDLETAPLRDLLREFFKTSGLTVAAPGSALFDENTGLLRVHATAGEVGKISAALAFITETAPQITIDARFVDMPKATMRDLGLDWFAGRDLPPPEPPLEDFIRSLSGITNQNIRITTGPVGRSSGILNPGQSRALIQHFERAPGVDMLSSPRVTTLSGRQAQIASYEATTVITEYTSEDLFTTSTIDTGVRVDVTATAAEDEFELRLQWSWAVTEFLGYDRPYNTQNHRGSESIQPFPRVRIRSGPGIVQLWDGMTVVIDCGISTRKPPGPVQPVEPWHTFLFLTPRIIDPAGNMMRTDEEIETHVKTHGLPKQAGAR